MKLYREKAVSVLEDLMFDEDPLVRRAATEALTNCLYCEDIYNMFAKKEGPSFERLKLWVLYCGTDHEDADIREASQCITHTHIHIHPFLFLLFSLSAFFTLSLR
jgi:hypothetical protein